MNSGFFLGRSTPQWLAVISGTLSFIGVLVALFAAPFTVTFTVISGAIVVLASIWLGFLTNTATTPTFDPILKAGQGVTVTNKAGDFISSVTLPTVEEITGNAEVVVPEDAEDGVA